VWKSNDPALRKKIKLLFVTFVKTEAHEHINQKINLINWISTIQEEDILGKVENIQKEASDWWEGCHKQRGQNCNY
jgi:hypothetical protein